MYNSAALKAQAESASAHQKFDLEDTSDLLTWTDETRTDVLVKWATAVRTKIEAPTAVLVAWSLEGLFVEKGFAYPTDAAIARRIGRSCSTAKNGLATLERLGAIRRRSVLNGKKWERRIYPAAAIMQAAIPSRKVAPKVADQATHQPDRQATHQPDRQATHQPDRQATEISLDHTIDQREISRPIPDSPEQAANVVEFAVGVSEGVATATASSSRASRHIAPSESHTPDLPTRESRTPREDNGFDPELLWIIRRHGNGSAEHRAYDDRQRREMWELVNGDWLADEFDWRCVAEDSPFWAAWKMNKPAMLAKGYQVRKADDGGWQVRRRRRAAA